MTEQQRTRRLYKIARRALALRLGPGEPDPDLRRETQGVVDAGKHVAASEWLGSPGLTVYGSRDGVRHYGRPFWRGRW